MSDRGDIATCYICGNDDERTCVEDSPRLVRYYCLGRWRRVIACWNCRQVWADRIEEVPLDPSPF